MPHIITLSDDGTHFRQYVGLGYDFSQLRAGVKLAKISIYFSANSYAFISLDLSASGLVWYNQAQGGIGHRIKLGDKFALFCRVGMGAPLSAGARHLMLDLCCARL